MASEPGATMAVSAAADTARRNAGPPSGLNNSSDTVLSPTLARSARPSPSKSPAGSPENPSPYCTGTAKLPSPRPANSEKAFAGRILHMTVGHRQVH